MFFSFVIGGVSACVNSYSDCNPSVSIKPRANTPGVKAQETSNRKYIQRWIWTANYAIYQGYQGRSRNSDRHISPPSHRLFPHSSPDSCFASNWHPTATGSTGLDWFQLGSNGIKLGLPDSGFISCSFLVFRSLVFSLDLSLLSFLAFAHHSALFLLSSLTQFFRTFPRFSSRLVPCDCSQDTFVVSTRPPRLSTHPGSKEEISPAYWLVSQSPRTSFLQALLFQG